VNAPFSSRVSGKPRLSQIEVSPKPDVVASVKFV